MQYSIQILVMMRVMLRKIHRIIKSQWKIIRNLHRNSQKWEKNYSNHLEDSNILLNSFDFDVDLVQRARRLFTINGHQLQFQQFNKLLALLTFHIAQSHRTLEHHFQLDEVGLSRRVQEQYQRLLRGDKVIHTFNVQVFGVTAMTRTTFFVNSRFT